MSDLERISFWKRCALILAVIALTAIVAAQDANDAAVTARLEAAAHDRKQAPPEHVLPLTHPVGYSASMDSCAAGKCAPTQYVYQKGAR